MKRKLSIKWTVFILAPIILVSCATPDTIQTDPLPSWNDGPAKSAIIQFVNDVSSEDGPSYVKPAERIATFDNDGTLWCEQPVGQLEFITFQIFKLAPEHPEWKTEQPYKAILEGDKDFLLNALTENKGQTMMELAMTTHTGMTIDDFDASVDYFFNNTQNDTFKKKYNECIYQPMLELLQYLRDNGFKTYLCSGGGVDFMRAFSEEVYGIVPENVVGSFAMNSFQQVDGQWKIVKGSKNFFTNDGMTKPIGINNKIGRIPIFVAGNIRTGGDIGQLTYGHTNPLPNFQLLINHDDDVREFAYSEDDNASLNAAKKGGWQVVSMKNDWNRIFPFDSN